ncbi:heterokaryon incompatibility protein [Colletotrichum salicis]|uniref:Heterokaryon incompatibility protein n=1 Tax=Colletotrichum salicis TaxID=1209931 RepID=A0A135U361_9PEZI|nr:heterokaryon incompatibility protein [Colletotrichum salicis]
MSRWYERSCTEPDVVVCGGLPGCRSCFTLASIDDVQFATDLRIPQARVVESSSTYNLRWPACFDYVDSEPELPPTTSGSLLSGSTFLAGGNAGSSRPGTLGKIPNVSSEYVHLDSERAIFEALSYTWADSSGDAVRRRPMFIGPFWDVIPITRNCEDALRSVRLEGGRWVDSFCINQDDNEGLNAQVALMPKIYATGTGAFAYLGPAADDRDKALGAIFTSMSHPNCGHNGGESEACADCEKAIQMLLDRPHFQRLTVEEVSIGIAAYLMQAFGLGMAVLFLCRLMVAGKIDKSEEPGTDHVRLSMGSLSLQLAHPCEIRISSRSGYPEVTAIRLCNLRDSSTEDGQYRQPFVRYFENLVTGGAKDMSFKAFTPSDYAQLEVQKATFIEDCRLIVGEDIAQRILNLSAEPLLLKLAKYSNAHRSDSTLIDLWRTWKHFEARFKPYLEDERGIELLLRGITEPQRISEPYFKLTRYGRHLEVHDNKGHLMMSPKAMLLLLWSMLPETRHRGNQTIRAQKPLLSHIAVLNGFQNWAEITSSLLGAMASSVEYEDKSFFGVRSYVEIQKDWLKSFERFQHSITPHGSATMGDMEAIAYVLRSFSPTTSKPGMLPVKTRDWN